MCHLLYVDERPICASKAGQPRYSREILPPFAQSDGFHKSIRLMLQSFLLQIASACSNLRPLLMPAQEHKHAYVNRARQRVLEPSTARKLPLKPHGSCISSCMVGTMRPPATAAPAPSTRAHRLPARLCSCWAEQEGRHDARTTRSWVTGTSAHICQSTCGQASQGPAQFPTSGVRAALLASARRLSPGQWG